jgi:excisionase family DNA binding protein
MQQNKDLDDRLLTRAEVANIFQVSPSTITRWAELGKLPSVKTLGGHRRYEAKAVKALARDLIQMNVVRKEINMQKVLFDVPTMYGDHHVLEVRRILFETRGVEDVNASSCFQTVEVSFDPAKVSEEEIRAKLDEAGYLGDLQTPVESELPAQETRGNGDAYFRHTTAFEQTKQVVNFAQTVTYSGRPLWSCPGIGVISAAELEKE